MSEQIDIKQRVADLIAVGNEAIESFKKRWDDLAAQRLADEAARLKDSWVYEMEKVSPELPGWAREYVSYPDVKPSHTSYGVYIRLPGDLVEIRAAGTADHVNFYVWPDYALNCYEGSESDLSPWFVSSLGAPVEFNKMRYSDPFAAAVAFASGKAFANWRDMVAKAEKENQAHQASMGAQAAQAAQPQQEPAPAKPVDYLESARGGIVEYSYNEAVAAALVDIALSMREIRDSLGIIAGSV